LLAEAGHPGFRRIHFVSTCFHDDRFRFDLHQHLRRNEPADHQHAGRGTNIGEELAVCLPYFLPISQMGHEHARAYHLLERGSRPLQSALDIPDGLHSLRVGITRTNNFSVWR
jgi:hypothetical protein